MARDRTIAIDVHSDVALPIRPRRIEVLNGVDRRREWPDETKIAIVAEALVPGTVISHVARRYDINPSQLFGWVKRFRPSAAQMAEGSSLELPRFATAVVDRAAISDTTPVSAAAPAPEPASIEISIGRAIVRIRGAADAKTLALVLKALRVLA